MAKLDNVITTLLNVSDTTLTTSTAITFTDVLDLQEALSGILQVVFRTTSAGTAGKILHLYFIYSLDGTNFDEANTALMTEIGNFPIQADTNDHRVSIPLDGVTLSAPYAKLVAMCDNASNYGQLRSAKLSVRIAN